MQLLLPIHKAILALKKIWNGKTCDSCFVDGSFAYTEHLAYAILGTPEDFVNRDDSSFKEISRDFDNFSAHFIIAPAFTIDFLDLASADPTKSLVGLQDHVVDFNSDRKLAPDLALFSKVKKAKVPFNELDFQILVNNKMFQDWQPVTSLLAEREYQFQCGNNENDPKECRALHLGRFTLNVNDDMLIKIRKRNSNEDLRIIFIKRPRAVPSIEVVKQFPAGTSIQDILNKKMEQEFAWFGNKDEIETDAGNSVLLSFITGLDGNRMMEYAFANKPNEWHSSTDQKRTSNLNPYYVFIDNPKPGSTVDILVRYTDQRESIRHIKIHVRPKNSNANAFIISASLVLAFLLFMVGYYVNRKKNRRQLRHLLSKKKDLENKLQLLSGQLNPHFLFNSLNSIQNLVNKEDIANASTYISQVAVFLRTVMDMGRKEFISLQEELDISEAFLKLEQKRKSFKYLIKNRQAINLSHVDFPPLLLQPVLENSIHHGFNKEIKDPTIIIEITIHGNHLHISIADNGKGFQQPAWKKGHGLALVERRLSLMNEKPGSKITMEITAKTSEGTKTIFSFNNWL